MNPLVTEFNEKIRELKRLSEELRKDYLKVKSSEESLLIEDVVRTLDEGSWRIARAVYLEECRSARKSA